MLVANAFDAVAAKAVFKQRRALQRLAHGELCMRVLLLKIISRAHGAGGAACEAGARKAGGIGFKGFIRIRDGFACYLIMPKHVAHLFKLVENDNILPRAAQFPGLVKNFFDIAFAARRGNHFTGNF